MCVGGGGGGGDLWVRSDWVRGSDGSTGISDSYDMMILEHFSLLPILPS